MKRNYCKDCEWWQDTAEHCGTSIMAPPIIEDDKHKAVRLGTCHLTNHFETTREDDWCGEFTKKSE